VGEDRDGEDFFGAYLVCRTGSAPAGVAAVARWAEYLRWARELGGGWRFASYDGDHMQGCVPQLLAALAAETGAPALYAWVMAGETADLFGHGPRTGDWRGVLSPGAYEMYLLPGRTLADLPTPAQATAAATAWAAEAGLSPDEPEVRAVFQTADEPTDTQFCSLLGALGIAAR
jgi:hypothetical protein